MPKRNHKLTQTYIGRNMTDLLPTSEEAASHLRSVLDNATQDEWNSGVAWYEEASIIADDLGVDFTAGCGILAALSPSSSWDTNVEGAYHLAATGEDWYQQSALFNERAHACRIGSAPLSVLGGRKVRSFYRNISEPYRVGPVTIDRHAVSILIGRPLRSNDKRLERKGVYVWCAGVYRAEGRRLNIPPQCVQAVAWLTWRRMYDPAFRAAHRHDLDEMF